MAPQNIAVYSLSDVKNTTDDALPNYLTSLKFKQSHRLTDIRLALGYTAVIIAALTFYADYKLGWDKTKAATFWAVLVYFTLNGALTFWIWGIEKGTVFTGEVDQPGIGMSSLSIASSVQKHTPIYNLVVHLESHGNKNRKLELSSPFTRWFDADGFFVARPFQQWLASEIPLIGQVDPQNKNVGGTNGDAKMSGPLEQQDGGLPPGSASSDHTPASTRSRKGRKGPDR